MIAHNKVEYTPEMIDAVSALMKAGQIETGEKVRECEERIAALTGSEDCALVSSGLSALRLALQAVGIEAHDGVIVPAYSCVALQDAVLSIGARPILADILPDLTLSPAGAAERCVGRIKAMIAVNTFNHPADVEFLNTSGLPIIEDMAHGLGRLRGRIGATSFRPTKMVSGIGGGAVFGSGSDIAQVRGLRDYGDRMPGTRLNETATELEAAVVLARLEEQNQLERKRITACHVYDNLRSAVSFKGENEGHYRYIMRVPNASAVVEACKAKGVSVEQPVWDYRSHVYWPPLPETDRAFEEVISLPLWPTITQEEQEKVVSVLTSVL